MAINYQKLFGDLGLLIRTANAYRVTFTGAVDAESTRKAAELANGRYEEAGDGSGQLGDWRLGGAVKGANTDSGGRLHISLTDSAGTATVSLYKASAKLAGDLVAQGSAPSTGTVAVILGEQNSSGLSGTVTLAYTADDTDITLVPPFRSTEHHRLFEQMARSDDAHRQTLGAWVQAEAAIARDYVTTIAKEEIAATFSTVEEILADMAEKMTTDSQTLDANTVSATVAVADSGNAGNGTMSAVAVDQMTQTQSFRVECVSANTVGQETWEVHGSESGRLSESVTTGVAYSPATGGVSFTISAGGTDFAVGDKFTFDTTSSDEGTIQTFLRDHFNLVLPASSGGSETISDSLAE